MAVKYNGANVNDIKYKVGTTTYNVNILKKDDTITWCRPFTYTQGTLPTGVASLVCTRNSTNQPGASTGTIASGGTIYYSDKLTLVATAQSGYHFGDDQSVTTQTYTVNSVTGNVSWTPDTPNINTYTITWKWLSAYPDTWTTATESYNYGATPSRTAPSTVTSGNARKVFANWDSLAAVTSSRTITAVYTQQYYATISPSYCTANRSTGWYNSGTVITWTANDNYSFGGSAVKDTTTTTISSGTTYSKSPGYVKCTISGTRCSANKTSGSILAVGTTITWTSSSNCAFNSAGTTTTATQNVALGTTSYSKSADYIYVTVSGTNCTANKSTGWFAYNTQCTWTASTNYAFDSSGTTTSTANFTSAGTTYTKTPGYGKYTVTGTNCTANVSTGWYAVTTSKSTTFTANSGWSFGGTTAQDTTSKSAAVPGSVSASPSYFYLTISAGTGCTANKSSGFYNTAQTITWTRSTGYAFDSSGTTTASQTTSATPGTYSKSPTHGYYTLSLTNCAYNSGNNAGWYVLGTKPSTTVKANSGWSFGGSTAQDTTSIGGDTTVPCTKSASPSYFYITVNAGTGCSANKSSGFYTSSTKPSSITWTPTTYYSFDAGETQTSYTNSSISNAPATYAATPTNYKASAINNNSYATANKNNTTYYASGTNITWTAGTSYSFGGSTAGDTTTSGPITAGGTFNAPNPGYVKCTISGTNCGANKTSGTILAVGTTITWTGTTGTNYKYGFGSGATWSDSYATTTQDVALGTTSYDKTTDKVWYNVTITKNAGTASSDYSSGYLLKGTIVTITATANTSTVKYSYSDSSANVHTLPYPVIEAGQSISSPRVYTWYYVQINATNSTAHFGPPQGRVITSGSSDWYIDGSLITWTPATNYSFSAGTSQTNTKAFISSATALAESPSYGYVTVTKTRCTGIDTGYRAIGATTFTANTNCAYSADGTTTTQTKTVTAGGTISSSADYIYVTIGGSNNASIVKYGTSTTASTGWHSYNQRLTYNPATNYSYTAGTTQTAKSDVYLVTPGATYSYSPTNYKLASCTANYCSAKVGSATGSAVSTSTYYASGSKIYWVADSNHSFAGSAVSDTRSGTTDITAGGTPSMTPGYTKCTISGTNCSANKTTGSLLGNGNDGVTQVTITWTGTSGTNYKYGFTSNTTWSDSYATTTQAVTAATTSYSKTASYLYYNVTINPKANSTATISSGYILNGTKVSFNVSAAATNTDYSFSSTDRNVDTKTDYATVSSAGQTIYGPRVYTWYNVTSVSGTNCITSTVAGWYFAETEIIWIANSGYAFDSSGTNRQLIPVEPGSNTCSATYFYITVNAGTGCSANQSSGFYTSSTKPSSITWTPSTYYSFDAGATQTSYTNSSISSAPATYTAKPTNYKAASIGTSSYCTADKDSSTYYAAGTMITWTAGNVYSFGGSTVGDTITTGPITAGQTFNAEPGYVKCTIETTNCEASETSGSILAVGTIITFTAATDIAFDENGTTILTATVSLSSYSFSASAQYAHVNIQAGTGCTVNKPIGWGWYRFGVTLIKWTPNTNYSFYSSGSSSAVSQGVWEAGVTYSRTPEYGHLTINTYHCSGTSSGWYAVGNKVISMTASSGWAFNENGGTTITETKTVPGTYYYSASYSVLNELVVSEFADNSVIFRNPNSNPSILITAKWRGTGQTVQWLNGTVLGPNALKDYYPEWSNWIDYTIEAYSTCDLYTKVSKSLWVDMYIEPDEG